MCTSLGQKLVTRYGEKSRDQRAAGGCVTAQQWADRIKSEMILPEGNKLATLILHALIGSDLCTAQGRVITGSSVKVPAQCLVMVKMQKKCMEFLGK